MEKRKEVHKVRSSVHELALVDDMLWKNEVMFRVTPVAHDLPDRPPLHNSFSIITANGTMKYISTCRSPTSSDGTFSILAQSVRETSIEADRKLLDKLNAPMSDSHSETRAEVYDVMSHIVCNGSIVE